MSAQRKSLEEFDEITGDRAAALRRQAARCRRLADAGLDRQTIDTLTAMAREYEQEVERIAPTC